MASDTTKNIDRKWYVVRAVSGKEKESKGII